MDMKIDDMSTETIKKYLEQREHNEEDEDKTYKELDDVNINEGEELEINFYNKERISQTIELKVNFNGKFEIDTCCAANVYLNGNDEEI